MSELVTVNETGLKSFNSVITSPKTQDYLQSVLGERKASFVNNITALVANNAMLQDCKPLTLLYAALKATALDLPLDANLGFAYVLPYNSKTGKEIESIEPSRAACDDGTIAVRFFKKATQDSHAPST